MATPEQIKNIDNILVYILVKKLVTPIVKMNSFKLGLVDGTGKIIREPSNPTEESALTSFDKIVLKLKRLLGSKLLILNKFLYLQTLSNTMYDKLVVKGNISQRTEMKRIVKDIQTIQEKYNTDSEQIIYSLLMENLEDSEGNEII